MATRKWTWTAVTVLGWAAAAWAAGPTPLTSLRAIHALDNARARESIPVEFEGTVTYYAKGDVDLFVQDGDVAIYAEAPRNALFAPGDRVLVHGKTRASFRPDVVADKVTLVRHGALPEPVSASYLQM